MSSPTSWTRTVLIAIALVTGCITNVDVGQSELTNYPERQSVLGSFFGSARTAFADLNTDGYDDLVVWTHGAQAWWGNDGGLEEPPSVYVYYGSAAGLPRTLGPDDADVSLSARDGEWISTIVVQDIDEDGAADLVVHAPITSSGDHNRYPAFPGRYLPEGEGSVYVVSGGTTWTSGTLEAMGHRTATYRTGEDVVLRTPYPHVDLDGVAGAEFLTRSYYESGVADQIFVRSLETGEVRATLSASSPYGTLQPRAIYDYDGDGHDDVVALYGRAEVADEFHPEQWQEFGLAIFLGPIDGDRVEGDENTISTQLVRVPPSVFDHVYGGYVREGDVRVAVGLFTPDDDRLDMLMVSDSGQGYVIKGNDAVADTFPPRAAGVEGTFWTSAGELESVQHVPAASGAPIDRLLLVTTHEVAIVSPRLGGTAEYPRAEPVVHASIDLTDQPAAHWWRYTVGGASFGDIDGDGKLDVALGTGRQPDQEDTRVHVLYGFGG
ncbi:MAG: hypothetical protein KC668_11230 [Myxococcales bacterium]|nr:hypothetical protein [Myxococcales bacterium]